MCTQENKAYELWSQKAKAAVLYISASPPKPVMCTHKDNARHGGARL